MTRKNRLNIQNEKDGSNLLLESERDPRKMETGPKEISKNDDQCDCKLRKGTSKKCLELFSKERDQHPKEIMETVESPDEESGNDGNKKQTRGNLHIEGDTVQENQNQELLLVADEIKKNLCLQDIDNPLFQQSSPSQFFPQLPDSNLNSSDYQLAKCIGSQIVPSCNFDFFKGNEYFELPHGLADELKLSLRVPPRYADSPTSVAAEAILSQQEARPLLLSRFEILESYAKGRLCLSCDSKTHRMPSCPFGEFVCPNCHRSSHRGEECLLRCRFCQRYHVGVSITVCIKQFRYPLERLLGLSLPLRETAAGAAAAALIAASSNGQYMGNGNPPQNHTGRLALPAGSRPDTAFGRSVYISNLPSGTTKEQLATSVESLLTKGNVIQVDFHERHAFVQLSTLPAAFELVEKRRSLEINGVVLKVQFKKTGVLSCPTSSTTNYCCSAPSSPFGISPTCSQSVSHAQSVSGENSYNQGFHSSFQLFVAPPSQTTVDELCKHVATKLREDVKKGLLSAQNYSHQGEKNTTMKKRGEPEYMSMTSEETKKNYARHGTDFRHRKIHPAAENCPSMPHDFSVEEQMSYHPHDHFYNQNFDNSFERPIERDSTRFFANQDQNMAFHPWEKNGMKYNQPIDFYDDGFKYRSIRRSKHGNRFSGFNRVSNVFVPLSSLGLSGNSSPATLLHSSSSIRDNDELKSRAVNSIPFGPEERDASSQDNEIPQILGESINYNIDPKMRRGQRNTFMRSDSQNSFNHLKHSNVSPGRSFQRILPWNEERPNAPDHFMAKRDAAQRDQLYSQTNLLRTIHQMLERTQNSSCSSPQGMFISEERRVKEDIPSYSQNCENNYNPLQCYDRGAPQQPQSAFPSPPINANESLRSQSPFFKESTYKELSSDENQNSIALGQTPHTPATPFTPYTPFTPTTPSMPSDTPALSSPKISLRKFFPGNMNSAHAADLWVRQDESTKNTESDSRCPRKVRDLNWQEMQADREKTLIKKTFFQETDIENFLQDLCTEKSEVSEELLQHLLCFVTSRDDNSKNVPLTAK